MSSLRRFHWLLLFLVFIPCLGALAVTPSRGASNRVFIAIGTGGPTGIYFVVGNSICRMVHKEAAEGRKKGHKHGVRCSAPSTGGSTYNIGQISEDELDFGIAQSDWQHHAYHGSNPSRVRKFADLQAVFAVHPEPFHMIVGEKSGIRTWDDLKGKRVNVGNPGSGQRGTMDVLMEAHGTKVSDFAIATEMTSTEQSTALCDGKIDAYGYTVGVPNAGVAVATDGCNARIINLDGNVEKALVKKFPYYSFADIPRGTYKTTVETVTTFGVIATFVTSAQVPDAVVYEVTRAVFENLQDFRKLHPAFANLEPKRMITDGLSAPLHPGAVKYYKERGWM